MGAHGPTRQWRPGLLIGFALVLLGVACKPKAQPTKAHPTPTATVQPTGTGPAMAPIKRSFVVPAGPMFAITAGEGLGPVRFGATVATVERLMEGKCEELTDQHCRYIRAGIEYELTDGVVSGMVVYRHDRPVEGSPGKLWGRTRCVIPPDITPRVIVSYVHSVLGKPQTSETITEPNPNRTALRETYPGLILEYDRGEYTKELVLGSIRVVKPEKPR